MATLRKRGKSWYLRWSFEGQKVERSLGPIAKREAEAARIAKEHELARGRGGLPGGPVFRAFAGQYLRWHAHEYPDSHYRIAQLTEQYLIPWFGDYPVGAIPRDVAEQYKRERNAAPSTVAKELRTLQAIINKAVEWGHIDRNPIRGVRPPRDLRDKPPPFYTAEELQRIYPAALDEVKAATWRLLANTGMRRGEILALRKEHVTEEGFRILSGERRTKSGKWRFVPQNRATREAMEILRTVDGPTVIPRVHPKSLSRAFDNTLRRARLDGSLHWLRHTYASHLVMAGVPLRTVQKLLGHSTVAVTERYAHLAPDYMQEIGEKVCL